MTFVCALCAKTAITTIMTSDSFELVHRRRHQRVRLRQPRPFHKNRSSANASYFWNGNLSLKYITILLALSDNLVARNGEKYNIGYHILTKCSSHLSEWVLRYTFAQKDIGVEINHYLSEISIAPSMRLQYCN